MAEWIALTEADREAVVAALPGGLGGYLKQWGWAHFAEAIEARLRAKNAPPEADEAEYDVFADDMHVASSCGPREMALAEARNYALQNLDDNLVVRIEQVRRAVVERFMRIEGNAKGGES